MAEALSPERPIDAPAVDPSGAGAVGLGREEVLVLDFGGQYSQLIARRLRECGVFAELLPHDTDLERIRLRSPKALVLSGGPASVYETAAPALRTELLEL
ncbi:MAG: GMP synthase (glutamine-hydrolyzing), partial [Acidobacteria bacterium]